MKNSTDYWFTIEPYVYINIASNCVLLYNTLDGATLESNKTEVVVLLKKILQEENCGVVLLKSEQYKQKEVNSFIRKLQEKYMGDIIDVTLSKGKPVQLLPYVNFPAKREKTYNFSRLENILQTLSEISIYIDHTIDIAKLISFVKSIPNELTFNVSGDLKENKDTNSLLSFLNKLSSPKNILCSYSNVMVLEPNFNNNFFYKVSVHFPIDIEQWNKSIQSLYHQDLPFEYIFDVTSLEECQQVERYVEQYQIGKYHLHPVYTGNNIDFFEKNIFLKKDDILSTSMSIKDFFFNQSMNSHDFGKINIMPNGDTYANVYHPLLGNIYVHSIDEIVEKELKEGKSWLRIRNQKPCKNCLYQWLCPPPSEYEIVLGRHNLCNVKE